MALMAQMPDKSVSLCLTDPPYGIGMAGNPVRQKHEKQDWDSHPPSKEIFDEILRVSKNQIIWGGNYFSQHLPSSKCFLVWNKLQPENFTLAMCEMAWASFDSPAKLFTQSVHKEGNAYHPTQKPVELIKWCMAKYSQPDDLIFDPFMGSWTTAVAAKQLGRRFIGAELSPAYCEVGRQRLRQEVLL